mgnify:FL=1
MDFTRFGTPYVWTDACARTPFDALTRAPFDVIHDWAGPFKFNQKTTPAKVVFSEALSLIYIPVWKAATTTITDIIHKKDRRAVGPHPHVCSTNDTVNRILNRNHSVLTLVRDPITRSVSG